jgi:hypothetical protein
MPESSRGNLKERLLILVAVLAFGWLVLSICEDRPVFLSDDGKDHRAFSSVDSWWSPPANNVNFSPLDRGRFATVKDTLQPEAQAALLEVPAKRVSAEEAARLTGKQLRADEEYILLRGVVLNEGTGGFDVRRERARCTHPPRQFGPSRGPNGP